MKLRLIEMEILAFGLRSEINAKVIDSLVDRYRDTLIPGVSVDPNKIDEQTKKLLTEELKKVYRVRRYSDEKDREAAMEQIKASGSAGGAVAIRHELNEQRALDQLKRQYQR